MIALFSALHQLYLRPLADRIHSEDGLEAVEYALVAALLAVVIIGAVAVFGGNGATGLSGLFSSIADRLNTEAGNVNAAPGA